MRRWGSDVYLTVPVVEALPTAEIAFAHQVRVKRATPSAASTLHICRYDGAAWEWVELTLIDDADLVAIAALTGTGLLARTAADTWALRTLASTSTGLVVTNGDGVSGNPSLALDAEIQALTALVSAADKLAYYTGSGTAALADLTAFGRSLIDDAAASNARTTLGLVIGTDVAAWDADLDALAALALTGIAVRSALNTWVQRSIAVGSTKLSVSNADGVLGNPTLDVVEANLTLSSLGGAVTDGQVPNTITLDNITQVTTRSHTSLSDIGTNTHAAVDTHVAATAAHGATGAVVGTTNTQTLTNKTLTEPVLTLEQGVAVAPTAEGRIAWDTDDNKLKIGDGAATKTISTDDAAAITGGSVTGITDLAVADGGTGASTAAAARTNLGLVIGTDVQAYDAELAALAGLTSAANKLPYFTGSGTAALADLTAAGRALVDDADAAAQRTTLGAAATEAAEASSSTQAGASSSAIGANVRLYDFFTLPTTEKWYVITGIEWSNKATVDGNVWCGADVVDADPPTIAGVATVAVGAPIAQAGASAVQRNSQIASQAIRGGTIIGVWFATDSATGAFGYTAVASSNSRKAITTGAPATADNTAWTASGNQFYVKSYYRGLG